MSYFDECEHNMGLVLEGYNKKWSEFLIYVQNEPIYKLEYLIQLTDETKQLLENLCFVSAKWNSINPLENKWNSSIICKSKEVEWYISVSKGDEEIIDFDVCQYEVETYPWGETVWNRKDIVRPNEILLLKRYMEDFDIISMCNDSDAAWSISES
jgi:hypothetical protein